jgi:hypothetical protein
MVPVADVATHQDSAPSQGLVVENPHPCNQIIIDFLTEPTDETADRGSPDSGRVSCGRVR